MKEPIHQAVSQSVNQSTHKTTNDMSIFLNQWEIYQAVVDANVMAHQQIKGHLRSYFKHYRTSAFSVLDLGCGDASVMSDVLHQTSVSSYTGIDLSTMALELAEHNTQKNALHNTQFMVGDLKHFKSVIAAKTFDIIVVGFSLHHLLADEKQAFFHQCQASLNEKGILIVYDVIRRHEENRATYLDRYCHVVEQQWQGRQGLTQEKIHTIHAHIRNSDYPQSLQELESMAHTAGFKNVTVAYCDKLAFHHLLYIDNDCFKALKNELHETRKNLQVSIEELETSNRELQATNAELQLMNQKLRKVNQKIAVKNSEIKASNANLKKEIEERRRAEHLVLKQERKLRMIINSEPAWVNICDREGVIMEVNPAGLVIMEAESEQELIGKKLLDLVVNKHKGKVQQCRRLLEIGETHKHTVEVKTLKGNTRWLEISTVRLPDELNNKIQIMSIICDQTHFKQTHDKLLQGQTELAHVMRLNTLGAMASGLAHELNQPLSAIGNYLSGCERRVRDNSCQQEEVLEVLHLANIQVQRAGEIIHQVKHFIKRDNLDIEVIDVNAAIENAVKLARGTGQCNHVHIDLDFTEPLAPVLANKVQIEQVIINLLLNGVEAMDEAGVHLPTLFIHTHLIKQEQVEVFVEDSGNGLSAEEKMEIFKPFHTTKSQGMGMGLCVSRSIIELYMGQLSVIDRKGGGSIFKFSLPVCKATL